MIVKPSPVERPLTQAQVYARWDGHIGDDADRQQAGRDRLGLGTIYGKLAGANSWADTQTIQRVIVPAKSAAGDPANVIGASAEHDSSGVSQLDIFSDETFGYSHNLRLVHSGLVNQNNAWAHLYGPKGTGTSDQAHMLKLDYVGSSETGTLTLLERGGGATKAQWSWGSDANTWYHFGAGSRIGTAKVSVAGDIASSGKISTSSTAEDSISTAGGIQAASDIRLGSRNFWLRGGFSSVYLGLDSDFADLSGIELRDNAGVTLARILAEPDLIRFRSADNVTFATFSIATPDSATASQVNIGNGRIDVGTRLVVRGTAADSIETAGGVDAAGRIFGAFFRGGVSTNSTNGSYTLSDEPAPDAVIWRNTGTGTTTLEGIEVPGTSAENFGRRLSIQAGTNRTIVIKHLAAGAENLARIRTPDGNDYTVSPNQMCDIIYTELGQWCIVGRP